MSSGQWSPNEVSNTLCLLFHCPQRVSLARIEYSVATGSNVSGVSLPARRDLSFSYGCQQGQGNDQARRPKRMYAFTNHGPHGLSWPTLLLVV